VAKIFGVLHMLGTTVGSTSIVVNNFRQPDPGRLLVGTEDRSNGVCVRLLTKDELNEALLSRETNYVAILGRGLCIYFVLILAMLLFHRISWLSFRSEC